MLDYGKSLQPHIKFDNADHAQSVDKVTPSATGSPGSADRTPCNDIKIEAVPKPQHMKMVRADDVGVGARAATEPPLRGENEIRDKYIQAQWETL